MNISLYGNYYFSYSKKYLEEDGHLVYLNHLSKDTDVCIVESRFFMYEIYKKLNFIKKRKIKLINSVLDIPPWVLQKQFPQNKKLKYLKQVLYNQAHKNQYFTNYIESLNQNKKKNKKMSDLLKSKILEYFNSHYGNRIYFQKNYKTFLKHSDLNLSLSKFSQFLVKKFLKLDTKVCYPCVNSDYLLSLPKTQIKFDAINISRIVPFKRQEIFVAAANHLGLKIAILGRYSDKTIKLDCPHYYFQNITDVFNLLNQTSFYVDASIFEGFGMTSVEAAFLDKPVITSDTCIHREVLGGYPLYFKRDNVDDLIEKMKLLLNKTYEMNNAEIKKKYSIQALKKRLLKHIESIT